MSQDASQALAENPLLQSKGLPAFDKIEVEHIEPAIDALLDSLEESLSELEANIIPSWEGLIEPLERIGDRLGLAWGIVGHLMGVKNSDSLRAAHEAMQPKVIAFSLRHGQSRAIYDGLQAIREGAAWSQLDDGQRRIIESSLRDARHSGVGLEGAEKARFNEIAEELGQCATRFSNNVLDATKAFSLMLHAPAEVDGVPESWRELAAQSAREEGDAPEATAESGPWRVTLDYPSLIPVMEHGRNRDLREKLYRANISRASSGELDNAPIIARTLELRRQSAQLLGYESYADLSLSSKMAPDVAAVDELMEELRSASHEAARKDLAELEAFAIESGASGEGLRHWDIAFWAERLREERFSYSEEELRPYFSFDHVLSGLFDLAQRLFGVQFRPADGETSVWHEDVRFFRVFDESDHEIAAFYLDPFSRPGEKRGGAWMDECLGRSSLFGPAPSSPRLPVAYLVCNQTPPVGDRPSLMSFDEVKTLFHEFGHGLQHMLTRVDYGLASGIRNVEWDAVELPSQFMENWCHHRGTLVGISGHFETGEALPDALFDKIEAARTYRTGSDMLRQLYFGMTDLELHHGHKPGGSESAFDVQRRIAELTTVLPPLPEDRFLCAFGHIFAGGYAAGYYSYKWAEVLSADAFAAFEEVDLDAADAVTEVGKRFRETVLALGGCKSPGEVFAQFRGRPPTADALLRHAGLAVS